MSRDDDPSELEQPATGTAMRIGVVLAILVAIVLLIWWVRPERGRGQPEQAHRILIAGGTPTDLGAAIAEAGFGSDQQTWSALEAEVLALADHGTFDLDALLDYADEHGYGFVAVMLEDLPGGWARGLLGVEPPESAVAAVIAVGDLQAESGPTVRYGGPESELEYAPGVRRSEGLRLALYQHPDLVRLWDDPTPEQKAQLVQLRGLDDARLLLDRANDQRADALGAWPALPDGALTQVWTDISGFPVAGGLLVVRRPSRLRVNDKRKVERVADPREVVFVPDSALAEPDPLSSLEHPPIELEIVAGAMGRPEPPTSLRHSPNHRWVVGIVGESELYHRYHATGATVIDHPVIDHRTAPLAISDLGHVISATQTRLDTDIGDVELIDLWASAAAWVSPDWASVALFSTHSGADYPAPHLLLIRPDPAGRSASLVSLTAESLLAPASFIRETAEIQELHATAAGLFVIVSHEIPAPLRIGSTSKTDRVRSLVRLRIPTDGPVPVRTDVTVIDAELLHAAVATPRRFDPVVLGILPSGGDFEFAPDGTWLCWSSFDFDNRRTVSAAPITDEGLGPVRVIDDSIGARPSDAPIGPWFGADARTIVYVDADPTALATKRDADPWTAEYLRIVTLK